MPTESIGRFISSDGYVHFYRRYMPPGTRRAIVIALHGIQSHSGWYTASSRVLASAGFEVWFLDRRGSGMNPQDRGHVPHADRLMHDLLQFREQILREMTDTNGATVPVHLLAVSWGAKIAAATIAARPGLFQGLALLYPGLFPKLTPRWDQRWRLSLARFLGITRRSVRIPLDDPALFTQDSDWQSFIRRDPLALHRATSGLFLAGQDLDRLVSQHTARFTGPTLLMLAGNDPIIDNEQTRDWFARLPSARKSLHCFSGARHTLEFEPCRDEAFAQLVDWMNQVTPE
jgi:acylglycerol lipase